MYVCTRIFFVHNTIQFLKPSTTIKRSDFVIACCCCLMLSFAKPEDSYNQPSHLSTLSSSIIQQIFEIENWVLETKKRLLAV